MATNTLRAGENIRVSWNVINSSGYALAGTWTDGVYLSTDARWDVNDQLLGTVTHSGGLAENEMLSVFLDAVIPGILPGEYYLLVRSDIHMQEQNDREAAELAQNLEAVKITVEVPELTVDTPVSGSIAKSGDCAVYQLLQNANETLRLMLDCDIFSTNMEIYVGYGYAPTREKYDSKVQKITDGSLLLNAPDSTRNVYVMLYSKSTSTAFDYTFEAKSIPMSIENVTGRDREIATDPFST